MALGIEPQNEIYTVLSIPLEWEENHILANHFRMLADEIEREEWEILSIRLATPINPRPFGKPSLECLCFNRPAR